MTCRIMPRKSRPRRDLARLDPCLPRPSRACSRPRSMLMTFAPRTISTVRCSGSRESRSSKGATCSIGAARASCSSSIRRARPAIPTSVNGAPVPMHGASGAGHMALAVSNAELPAWRAHLEANGVAIESEVTWPRGGRSLYVRDPAGNSVELASPLLWGLRGVARIDHGSMARARNSGIACK